MAPTTRNNQPVVLIPLGWLVGVKFHPTHTAHAKPKAQATSQTDLGTGMRARKRHKNHKYENVKFTVQGVLRQ